MSLGGGRGTTGELTYFAEQQLLRQPALQRKSLCPERMIFPLFSATEIWRGVSVAMRLLRAKVSARAAPAVFANDRSSFPGILSHRNSSRSRRGNFRSTAAWRGPLIARQLYEASCQAAAALAAAACGRGSVPGESWPLSWRGLEDPALRSQEISGREFSCSNPTSQP